MAHSASYKYLVSFFTASTLALLLMVDVQYIQSVSTSDLSASETKFIMKQSFRKQNDTSGDTSRATATATAVTTPLRTAPVPLSFGTDHHVTKRYCMCTCKLPDFNLAEACPVAPTGGSCPTRRDFWTESQIDADCHSLLRDACEGYGPTGELRWGVLLDCSAVVSGR
ncbi:hypothetical protein HY213_03770 [Candidatus Peregrinibacteria bacterium]|nr:hypothetical protein [Candidatus Peregrinibacteria bacterium]